MTLDHGQICARFKEIRLELNPVTGKSAIVVVAASFVK
jgi:hypothetical protein